MSCRNLRIYLGPNFQHRILPNLHHALRPDGFLFVGLVKGTRRHGGLFAPRSKSHRIVRKMPPPGTLALPTLASRCPRKRVLFPGDTRGQLSGHALWWWVEARILQANALAACWCMAGRRAVLLLPY